MGDASGSEKGIRIAIDVSSEISLLLLEHKQITFIQSQYRKRINPF